MKQYILVAFAFSPWIALFFVLLFWLAGGFAPSTTQQLASAPTAAPVAATAPQPTLGPTATAEAPTVAPEPTQPPIDTSATETAISEAFPCNVGMVKANRESMIYHLPGQRDYARFRTGVTCIATEEAAQAAGYRIALR